MKFYTLVDMNGQKFVGISEDIARLLALVARVAGDKEAPFATTKDALAVIQEGQILEVRATPRLSRVIQDVGKSGNTLKALLEELQKPE